MPPDDPKPRFDWLEWLRSRFDARIREQAQLLPGKRSSLRKGENSPMPDKPDNPVPSRGQGTAPKRARKPSKPKPTMWQKIWSWGVVGALVCFLWGGGVTLMTSARFIAADCLYVAGALLLMLKFITWEEHEHKSQVKKLFHIALCVIAVSSLALGFSAYNHYVNKAWPFSASSTSPPATSAPHTHKTGKVANASPSPTLNPADAANKKLILESRDLYSAIASFAAEWRASFHDIPSDAPPEAVLKARTLIDDSNLAQYKSRYQGRAINMREQLLEQLPGKCRNDRTRVAFGDDPTLGDAGRKTVLTPETVSQELRRLTEALQRGGC